MTPVAEDDCYPDAATLYRRWGPAGVRMSPDTVATVARSILDRTPTLERFFAADLGGVQVEEKQVSIQPDLLARLPEKTGAVFAGRWREWPGCAKRSRRPPVTTWPTCGWPPSPWSGR